MFSKTESRKLQAENMNILKAMKLVNAYRSNKIRVGYSKQQCKKTDDRLLKLGKIKNVRIAGCKNTSNIQSHSVEEYFFTNVYIYGLPSNEFFSRFQKS